MDVGVLGYVAGADQSGTRRARGQPGVGGEGLIGADTTGERIRPASCGLAPLPKPGVDPLPTWSASRWQSLTSEPQLGVAPHLQGDRRFFSGTRGTTGRGFRSGIRGFGCSTTMLRESKSLGQNVDVDLFQRSAGVLEDVVLVVQAGKWVGQGQLVPEALMDPEGQLAWRHLAGEHPGGKCSCSGFLSGDAAQGVQSEAQFVECWRKEIGNVVIRLRACARGQPPQGGAVEAGDEGVTGASDDIGCADRAYAPEGGLVLQGQ